MEFESAGMNFRVVKIHALKQYHLVRKISPILADLLPVLEEVTKGGKLANMSATPAEGEVKFDEIAKIASPIMIGLSKLSTEDADFVLFALLNAVLIQRSGTWSEVAVNGKLMQQDFELPLLMQLAGRAFMFNLSGFFAAAPRA